MSWQHITPHSISWQPSASGMATRLLTQDPFPVRQYRLAGDAVGTLRGLVLVQEGTGVLAEGTRIGAGDLLWRQEDSAVTAASAGITWSMLELPAALRPQALAITVGAADTPWQDFADPAGRPTQPVQILLEGPLSALRTRFVPSYEAGEHWHDFDTLYFIMAGDMQFGFEGQYHAGDVRQVQGGCSYGPEKPGPQGVEFVLFSCGGPVNLHWSDLEEPPRGSLEP